MPNTYRRIGRLEDRVHRLDMARRARENAQIDAWLATLSDADVDFMAGVAKHVIAGTVDALDPRDIERANTIAADMPRQEG